MKRYRNPPGVLAPLATYTHQVELSGPERLLILAGQVGVLPQLMWDDFMPRAC